MRITQHNGRTNSHGGTLTTSHNDRNFDISKADNIRNDGSQNVYLARGEGKWLQNGELSFDDAERRFYEKYLAEDLKKQNEKALKARHKERVQDIDQYRKSRKHCPEERIIQIGDVYENTDRETFLQCTQEYLNALRDLSRNHFAVLDVAIHFDEAVPHCHIRGTWIYRDDDGIMKTGQEKALEQAGYKPFCMREGRENDSRYCNRKIAFDAVMREKWLDICEEHGLKIEREPIPDGHHNRSKERMIADKCRDALEVIAKAERIRDAMEKDIASDVFRWYPEERQQKTRDALSRLADELER